MMQHIEAGDADEASYLELAKDIWLTLQRHYPDHPWLVSFQGGAMIVRHQVINAVVVSQVKQQGFGLLLAKDKLDNPQEVTQSAVMAGGAMLELFSLPRGKWDGREPTIPKDWIPKQQAGFA